MSGRPTFRLDRRWPPLRTVMAPLAVLSILAIAGCAGGVDEESTAPAVPDSPSSAPAAAPTPAGPPARIVRYQGYSAIVAGPGDTLPGLARRAGVDAAALARHNGVSVDVVLRPGDELVLPGS